MAIYSFQVTVMKKEIFRICWNNNIKVYEGYMNPEIVYNCLTLISKLCKYITLNFGIILA
ncbi:hypothetical protein AusDCA_1852 [Desulfitobacterium sp. AusDCA]